MRRLDSLEAELLAFVTGDTEIKSWRSVDWEKVGEEVYLPSWRSVTAEYNQALQGVRPVDFPQVASDLIAFGKRFTPKSQLPGVDVLKRRAAESVGAAFALALHKHGWLLRADPGEPFRFIRDETRVEPFSILNKLNSGELSKEAWEQQCRDAGFADWDLAPPLPLQVNLDV